MQRVIIDSDWGGDVLQLASVLLSRADEYKVLGATVVFGNASLRQNVENAGAILKLLGVDSCVPRVAGAATPSGVDRQPEGDEAHGRTGLGGVSLETSSIAPVGQLATDFLIDTIGKAPGRSVVLVATGPQTNVAQAIRKCPEVMRRLKEIRIMGGCVRPMPGYRVDDDLNRIEGGLTQRKGNITEWAEFNFQQAPEDARTVLESGIPVVLFPMDCTHQLTLTEEREERLANALEKAGPVRDKLLGLIKAPAVMDLAKFDLPPVMHDVNTTVSMVYPKLFGGSQGRVSVETQGARAGETFFEPDGGGPHWVAERIQDPDKVFEVLLASLRALLA